MPILKWKALRVSAGLANYRTFQITLSSKILVDAERVRITLLHEYAHLMAFSKYGRNGTGHGAAWRESMNLLGLHPHVRHRYEVERNQSRQAVIYRCSRCNQELARSRKWRRGTRYMHVHCGGTWRFVARKPMTEITQDA
ncbi:MAG: SprT-like domain-containing protein [Armatimonadetes bacterium]|nr:SprT-like domain-containing protein [Armatimonadota bacterium]